MLRGRIWLVVVVGAVALLSAPGASASGVNCLDCSGTYTGSWSAQIQHMAPDGTSSTEGLSLSWTETLKTPPGSASGVWSLVSAQGTVSLTDSAFQENDCSATLSPNGAFASDFTPYGPQVIGSSSGQSIMVNAYPPTYWSGNPSNPQPLLSSDSSHSGCSFTNQTAYENGFFTSFSGASCHYAGPSASEAMSFPSETTATVSDNCDAQGSDSSGGSGTATLSSQLTLSSPRVCSVAAAGGGPATSRRGTADLRSEVLAHQSASGKLGVTPRRGPLRNSADNTVASFKLTASASGGCPPYSYSWHRDKAPSGATVTPGDANGQTIAVTATCPRRRGKNGVSIVPASCDREPLKYTVTALDSAGTSARSSIVIFSVFSQGQTFYSPGDPAERRAWIKTLKGMNNSLAEQCAVDNVVSDILDAGAWEGSWGGLNPLPGPVSSPAAGAAACAHKELDAVKQRFVEGARALKVAEKDPPRDDFSTVAVPALLAAAPAPRCTGRRAALCREIGRDREAADGELEQALVIADSIATTIDRHSGAVSAGDQRAAKLQDAVYRAQQGEVARLLARDNRARSQLALALRRARLDFVFAPSFAGDPVAFLRRAAARLSARSRSAVDAMLASLSLFQPSIGSSYVGDLARAIPTSGLARGALDTNDEVSSMVRALAAQNQIGRPLAARLLADLRRSPAAAGASVSAATSALENDLAAVTGGARPLLEAASGLPTRGYNGGPSDGEGNG